MTPESLSLPLRMTKWLSAEVSSLGVGRGLGEFS